MIRGLKSPYPKISNVLNPQRVTLSGNEGPNDFAYKVNFDMLTEAHFNEYKTMWVQIEEDYDKFNDECVKTSIVQTYATNVNNHIHTVSGQIKDGCSFTCDSGYQTHIPDTTPLSGHCNVETDLECGIFCKGDKFV